MRTEIVIPARLASTRLPEKLLLRATGKSVLQHTFEAARLATMPQGITIAVDSLRMQQEVESFGGRAVMTDPALPSGTDRVAEVAKELSHVQLFVNVQGDEPEISAEAIDMTAQLLCDNTDAQIATLATPIRQRQILDDPACVKVVCDHVGRALYFSRSAIPHARVWNDALLATDPPHFLHHLGIYAYRRDFLMQLSTFPASPFEQLEKLEQLRFLQAGCKIVVGIIAQASKGIDTLEDYQAFVKRRCEVTGIRP